MRSPLGPRLLLAVAVVVQLLALYWPRVPSTAADDVPGLDKLVHAALFGAVLLAAALARAPLALVGGLLAVHALLSEVLQESVLPGRSGDPWDAAADLAGLAAAALLLRGRAARAQAAPGGAPEPVREDAGTASG